MGLPSCIIGHKDVKHDCQTPHRLKGAKTVKLHGISWSRMTDVNTPHKYGSKCKKKHSRPIAKGSKTVKVEGGLGAGRKTDKVASCTAVNQGWEDILTGG
jgi:uncharacterized Zn-binding protein involved in type VI secretion